MDPIKRKTLTQTLRGITAAATLAAVPATVKAAVSRDTQHSDISAAVDHLQAHMSELGLNVQVIPTPEHPAMWVRISNVSDKAVTLDHIAPSLIRSDNRLYDINSVLNGKARKIFPNTDYTQMIEPLIT